MNKPLITQRLAPAAENAVGGAIRRNVPFILDAIERNMNDTNGIECELPVTIKLKFQAYSHECVSMEIESVSFTRKLQHSDTDFDEVVVDLRQPDLPGLE
jgi:hypothetical protein